MEQHVQGCVGCMLPEIFKSWLDIILKGLLQLKQNFPLDAEITKWDSEVCAMQEVSELETTTDPCS